MVSTVLDLLLYSLAIAFALFRNNVSGLSLKLNLRIKAA